MSVIEPATPSSDRVVRRRAVVVVVRALGFVVVLGVAYFVLPFTSSLAVDTVVELLAGLLVIGLLLFWQIRGILRSPIPGAQAAAALSITLSSFLILFATTYYVTADADPSGFSEQMTRLDALYFTITTFATVGFGDITAVSQLTRGLVALQMVLGLLLVGVIARVVLGAVQMARGRQGPNRRG